MRSLGVVGGGLRRWRWALRLTGVVPMVMVRLGVACARRAWLAPGRAGSRGRMTVALVVGALALSAAVIGGETRLGADGPLGANPPNPPHSISFSEKRPTKFTVNWQPGDPIAGQPALTGFGLMRRTVGTPWPPDSHAVVRGPNDRKYTFTGLDPSTAYEIRIRACNGKNSCSAWVNGTVTTAAISAPTGKHTISVDQVTRTTARLKWSPDADTGGVSLTGFGIRWREKGDAWPSQAQAPNVPPGDRRYIITGLLKNKMYEVSIQACNGPNRCSPWTSPVEFMTLADPPDPETTVSVTPTAPSDSVSGTLSADPPAINHGDCSLLTWTTTNADLITLATIDQAIGTVSRNGGSREVCPDTDTVYTFRVLGPGGPDTSSVEITVGPAPETLKLATPVDLDVTPISDRNTRLSWIADRRATHHNIYLRLYPSDAYPDDDWQLRRTVRRLVSTPHFDFNLDGIYFGGTDFAHYKAFEIKINSVVQSGDENAPDPSDDSTSIVIVHTPMLEADGHSPGSGENTAQARIRWLPIDDILGTSEDDESDRQGEFSFRLRKAGQKHRLYHGWDGETYEFISTFQQNPLSGGSTLSGGNTITGLERDALYAIQLVYEEDGFPTIFAARDMHVWPSAHAPNWGSRVATLPVNYRPTSPEFHFRICEDTFKTGSPEQWRNIIVHAMEQWETATNRWRTLNNVVTMTFDAYTAAEVAAESSLSSDLIGTSKPCADFDYFVGRAIYKYNILRQSFTDTGSVSRFAVNFIHRLRTTQVMGRKNTLADEQQLDLDHHEIAMDDTPAAEILEMRAIGVFSELSTNLGFSWCWEGTGRYSGCATRERSDSGWIRDIFVRDVFLTDQLGIPGVDPFVDEEDVHLVSCDAKKYRAYRVVLHEGGHALGIGYGMDGQGQERHHPSIPYSVMSYLDHAHRYCHPTALDVLVLGVLYGY